MDPFKTTFMKLFTLLVLFLEVIEGKLDIKCIKGRKQVVDISEYGFGNIYSPGYTERKPYPNEMTCQLDLIAQEEKYIRLTFNHIDLPLYCGIDRVMVIDYLMDKPESAGIYCGNVRVPDYISITNKIGIHFMTSLFGTGEGFNITYREVSNRELCKDGEFQCRNRKCISKENTICNGEDDCEDGTDEENCGYPVEVPAECGLPDIQPVTERGVVDRIVGGREAARGSWPWQVDLQAAQILINGHFCGGSLLNSQWFVTAAHCLPSLNKSFAARVHLGNHHKYKKDPYEQVRYVQDFFVYGMEKEQFLKEVFENFTHDIALVKMNAPVKMNPHVKVVCLPKSNEELKIGQKCFSTGWGSTRGSGLESVLKQAEHPIQTAEKCDNDFLEFNNKTMICAGRMELLHGLCYGDSGGPLVCKKDGKWHLYGITSFLIRHNFMNTGFCGTPNSPSGFSKVSSKIDWIKTVILNNS